MYKGPKVPSLLKVHSSLLVILLRIDVTHLKDFSLQVQKLPMSFNTTTDINEVVILNFPIR